jgi:hypothetical protein
MMRIQEYKSVNAISPKELDNAVNRQLKLGFQPYGSPYVVGSGSLQTIYQAMVKMEGDAPSGDTPELKERNIVPPEPASVG